MKLSIKNCILLILMLLSAGLGVALRPTISLADARTPIDLKAMVPTTFGDWQEQLNDSSRIVNPQQKQAIDKIYTQTLSRTYINRHGYRIMLSIAYGADQTDSIQVHLPEGCYRGEGFAITGKTKTMMQTPYGNIPISRLIATQGIRNEPISYWVVVGRVVTRDLWEMKKAKLGYALKGEIADGILIRVSSITADAELGYEIQREFSQAMLKAVTPEQRAWLIGDSS